MSRTLTCALIASFMMFGATACTKSEEPAAPAAKAPAVEEKAPAAEAPAKAPMDAPAEAPAAAPEAPAPQPGNPET